MQVISSGQCIQLHDFPELNTVAKYNEGNTTGAFDFQFMRQSSLFLTSNPGLPVEYLNLPQSPADEIVFLRRIRTDIANTVACPTRNGSEIAVGTNMGAVKIIHYKDIQETQKFNPPSTKDAVVALSFNCQDDQLASLHESGTIQVFGLKTGVRTDQITFDKEVSHIRFHPKRKLHLGMVSYDGSVHIYDTQAKKRVFTHMAHQSPCRDLAMSPVNDNCLVSVGYDHLINLFDTRTKIASIQLTTAHPLSACAISECGSFCCVGNLRGQLLGYDFRQLKEPLIQTRQSHSAPVKRVEFVPLEEGSLSFTEKNNGGEQEQRMQVGRRDSMQHFFDHHYKRLPEQRKLSNLFSGENNSGTRISLGHDLKRLLREEEPVRSRDHSQCSSSSDVEFVAFEPGVPKLESIKSENVKVKTEPTSQLVSLMSISSTCHDDSVPKSPLEPQLRRLIKRSASGLSRSNGTEEQIIPEHEEFPKISQPVRSALQTSTPLNSGSAQPSPPMLSKKVLISEKDHCDGDTLEHRNGKSHLNGGGGEDKQAPQILITNEVEGRLVEKIDRMEKQLQFELEGNTWELRNENMNMFLKQMEAIESLQKSVNDLTIGMNCLIQSDDFIADYFRLRLENEELKARLMGNGH